jgi:CheY-like chemotaxis protein
MATILIVDDEAAICSIFERTLRNCGHTIYTATNGLHALAILKRQPIDLLLTDLAMPEMDGAELISWVCQSAQPPDIVIITADLITYHTNPVLACANCILDKPLSLTRLKEVVHAVLPCPTASLQQRALI